jgi:hypothetical protein
LEVLGRFVLLAILPLLVALVNSGQLMGSLHLLIQGVFVLGCNEA